MRYIVHKQLALNVKEGGISTMSKQELKQKGFTIIEVVLVLAIAALIFLMVFIALPALQRNQRDAARKDVLGKVASAVTTYQSNNRGTQPAKGSDLKGYADGTTPNNEKGETNSATSVAYAATSNDTIVDSNYIVNVKNGGTGVGNASTNVVQIFTGSKCNPGGNAAVPGSTRNAAVVLQMENGLAFVCQDV